jgi:hypothetical protein
MSDNPESFEARKILFQNGRPAQILRLRQAMDAAEIQKALNFENSQAAIIITGNTKPFSPQLKNRLTDLLSRGVAQAAADSEAVIIDDGGGTGISEIMGQGVADRGRRTRLVGVLSAGNNINPEGLVVDGDQSLDANHTHFILNEQDRQGWQAEAMSRLAEVVSCNKDWIVTILAGGDSSGTAMDLALETVRRKWNLVVIEGSGPLADEIARLKQEKLFWERHKGSLWSLVHWLPFVNHLGRLRDTNPYLYEVISDGKISIIGKKSEAGELRGRIRNFFTHPPEENLLRNAWQKFAIYDQNSKRHRVQWHRLKKVPLYLGVLSTLMVLIYSASGDIPSVTGGSSNDIWMTLYKNFMTWLASIQAIPGWNLFFRFTIILLPIAVSIFIGIETRLKPGSKYILLRGAAEAVKRGIYSYRVLKDTDVNEKEFILPHDEKSLNEHLEKVSKLLLESDVKESALAPYGGQIPPEMYAAADDDGLGTLPPEKYLEVRIVDQIQFYTTRTNQYEKQIRALRIWIFVLGGAGTFLAAIGAQYWLPLTAAVVSAATAYLEYQQLEQILTKYNLTRASLENTKSKWFSLDVKDRPAYVSTMVRDVEAILESENQGWVQYVNQVQQGQKSENQNALEGASSSNEVPVGARQQ